jgi:hypothetical protein
VLLLLLCCVRLDAAELRLDAPVKVCRAEAFQSEVRKIVIHDVFDDHFAVDFPAGAMIYRGKIALSSLFSLLRVCAEKAQEGLGCLSLCRSLLSPARVLCRLQPRRTRSRRRRAREMSDGGRDERYSRDRCLSSSPQSFPFVTKLAVRKSHIMLLALFAVVARSDLRSFLLFFSFLFASDDLCLAWLLSMMMTTMMLSGIITTKLLQLKPDD